MQVVATETLGAPMVDPNCLVVDYAVEHSAQSVGASNPAEFAMATWRFITS